MKVFAYHRFEYPPWPLLSPGAGEMTLVGGKVPDFQKINPFGVYHNTWGGGHTNVMGMADVSLVPFRGMHSTAS